MKDTSVKINKELEKARKDMVDCQPAFDELLLFSLERRHLDIPEYSNILLSNTEENGITLKDHLQENVRFFKLAEIAFDSNEKIKGIMQDNYLKNLI